MRSTRPSCLAGVKLFDAQQNEVRSNTIVGNGDGIALMSGTRGTIVTDNTISRSGGGGLLVRDSNGNRLERNRVADGGDLGIGLERASGNTLAANTVVRNSDGGIVIGAGSDDNHVQGNRLRDSGHTGILVTDSVRNSLISNVSHGMSDSGITLEDANHSVVRGNDVRFNAGGLQLDGSSRNRLRSNTASETRGIGIELGGGSSGTTSCGARPTRTAPWGSTSPMRR